MAKQEKEKLLLRPKSLTVEQIAVEAMKSLIITNPNAEVNKIVEWSYEIAEAMKK